MNYADRPWLKSYTLGPYKLEQSLAPYPHKPVSEILNRVAQEYPNQTAILFEAKELKYHQLKSRVDSLANAFIRLGLGKGDRVCIFLPNCPEYVITYWAILEAGGVVVPTSILRTDDGLFHEVSSSGSRYIVCMDFHLDRVMSLLDRTDMEGILVTAGAGYLGQPVTASLPKRVYDFASLISAPDSLSPQVESDPLVDLCELAFTGGATGLP
jgi:long-chain acyl-CoA synthetase